MNQAINFKKALSEIKLAVTTIGMPPTDDFVKLCQYVTDYMIARYELGDESDINCGYCFIWAYLVWALWPHGGVTFSTITGHVVVVYKKLYFDSEHIKGAKDTTGFCGFCTRSDVAMHVDVTWMCWFWARNGRQLRELRRLVRKMTPQIYTKIRDNGRMYWKNHWDFYGFKHLPHLPEVHA